jgi:hypothetical protein
LDELSSLSKGSQNNKTRDSNNKSQNNAGSAVYVIDDTTSAVKCDSTSIIPAKEVTVEPINTITDIV